MRNDDIDRLLRSAANASQERLDEAPFGFATRVIAGWRSDASSGDDVAEITRFLRRAGAIGLAIVLLAGTTAYRQFREQAMLAGPQTNEYAIADSAIQSEFRQ
jgi:hypothetical protein